jgi:hypothetical protein
MTISKDIDGEWRSAQICSIKKFDFGRYAYTLEANINTFDPTTVLGFYVIDSEGVQANNNEIDIEISKWSLDFINRSNLWFILRGDVSKVPRVYYDKLVNMNENTNITHHEFTWNTNNVSFESRQGVENILAQWTYFPKEGYESVSIPQVPCHLCINYWNHQGNVPFDNKPSSIIVHDVDYVGKNSTWNQSNSENDTDNENESLSGNGIVNESMNVTEMKNKSYSESIDRLNVASLVNEHLYPLVKDYVPIKIFINADDHDLKQQLVDLVKSLAQNNKLSFDSLSQEDLGNVNKDILEIVKDNVMKMTDNMKVYRNPMNFTITTNENNGNTMIYTNGVTKSLLENSVWTLPYFMVWYLIMIGLF